ncbi:hypothetical protein [Tolypothrix sp. VBCCA 56010]|uniref:hypothetical protein n=1 Tax=Tolypothrix sp. VBCCA 56010 TaxID=3137731 RepID=UPI003D7E7FD1
MGNGQWAMGIKPNFDLSPLGRLPHDGRCFKPGNPSNALPPPCPMTAGASSRGTRPTHCLPHAPLSTIHFHSAPLKTRF